jgi:hypothetical protein
MLADVTKLLHFWQNSEQSDPEKTGKFGFENNIVRFITLYSTHHKNGPRD